ncbi:hypothetical protein DTS60_21415 [Salmonella enterica]|nr:hypothetical protein [Salmonella enterica]
MVLFLMMKIISDMILCVLLNYHIICPFPAVQIRFPAVPDPLHPPRRAATTNTRCSGVLS